jgi:hypothetical protein
MQIYKDTNPQTYNYDRMKEEKNREKIMNDSGSNGTVKRVN